MVTGWEEITKELTPFEKEKIYPWLIAAWKKHELEEYVNMKAMVS